MKTTTTKNVDSWLGTKAVKDNIENLSGNMGTAPNKGISWNGKKITYKKAEIHIYMPKTNITPELETEWIKKLSQYNPDITYKINALENFIK
ncbi:hypothetical protein [Flavobacterium sp. IMCC34518]|uniref:hypothetical protein n=1 Tax=Flavobacterium sp. IMCC34518 TaxID=3003623 RepID=UPI0022AC3947|nr:hypothetical protein [Flavobacterium sp. IMCC34518]